MNRTALKKALFEKVKELEDEIREGLNYGTPHLVGEIDPFGESDEGVEIVPVVFSDSVHRWILNGEGSLLFMFPVDDPNPRRVFLELWAFLNGKSQGSALEPGSVIKGILKTALQRKGYGVVWMNVMEDENSGYIEVLAVKGGVRYRMTFEKIGADEFMLIEMERV